MDMVRHNFKREIPMSPKAQLSTKKSQKNI